MGKVICIWLLAALALVSASPLVDQDLVKKILDAKPEDNDILLGDPQSLTDDSLVKSQNTTENDPQETIVTTLTPDTETPLRDIVTDVSVSADSTPEILSTEIAPQSSSTKASTEVSIDISTEAPTPEIPVVIPESVSSPENDQAQVPENQFTDTDIQNLPEEEVFPFAEETDQILPFPEQFFPTPEEEIFPLPDEQESEDEQTDSYPYVPMIDVDMEEEAIFSQDETPIIIIEEQTYHSDEDETYDEDMPLSMIHEIIPVPVYDSEFEETYVNLGDEEQISEFDEPEYVPEVIVVGMEETEPIEPMSGFEEPEIHENPIIPTYFEDIPEDDTPLIIDEQGVPIPGAYLVSDTDENTESLEEPTLVIRDDMQPFPIEELSPEDIFFTREDEILNTESLISGENIQVTLDDDYDEGETWLDESIFPENPARYPYEDNYDLGEIPVGEESEPLPELEVIPVLVDDMVIEDDYEDDMTLNDSILDLDAQAEIDSPNFFNDDQTPISEETLIVMAPEENFTDDEEPRLEIIPSENYPLNPTDPFSVDVSMVSVPMEENPEMFAVYPDMDNGQIVPFDDVPLDGPIMNDNDGFLLPNNPGRYPITFPADMPLRHNLPVFPQEWNEQSYFQPPMSSHEYSDEDDSSFEAPLSHEFPIMPPVLDDFNDDDHHHDEYDDHDDHDFIDDSSFLEPSSHLHFPSDFQTKPTFPNILRQFINPNNIVPFKEFDYHGPNTFPVNMDETEIAFEPELQNNEEGNIQQQEFDSSLMSSDPMFNMLNSMMPMSDAQDNMHEQNMNTDVNPFEETFTPNSQQSDREITVFFFRPYRQKPLNYNRYPIYNQQTYNYNPLQDYPFGSRPYNGVSGAYPSPSNYAPAYGGSYPSDPIQSRYPIYYNNNGRPYNNYNPYNYQFPAW